MYVIILQSSSTREAHADEDRRLHTKAPCSPWLHKHRASPLHDRSPSKKNASRNGYGRKSQTRSSGKTKTPRQMKRRVLKTCSARKPLGGMMKASIGDHGCSDQFKRESWTERERRHWTG